MKSKRNKWQECGRKKRYPSEHVALREASKSEKFRNIQLDVYYCDLCNGWHLTSRISYPNYSIEKKLKGVNFDRTE